MSATFVLPQGWSETTFGEVVANVSINEKKLPKGQYSESGRFPVVDQGQQFIGGYTDDEQKVVSEDLPLLVFGDHTRAFKFLDQPFVPGADGVKVLKPIGVNPKWLYQIAHALEFPDKGYARHFQHLKSAKLFVPPLPEQRRIVAEIEKQFTRLEAGVAALRRVQANLKRYRAAVLKAACEGKLVPTEAELWKEELRIKKEETRQDEIKRAKSGTSSFLIPPSSLFESGEQLLKRILAERKARWEADQRAKTAAKTKDGILPSSFKLPPYRPPAAPDTANLSPLPAGWTWATVQQLNLANRPCAYGVLQPGEDIEGGVPFVRVGDINDGKVDLTNLKRISPALAAQYPRTKLHGGEFAITLVGAIGRTAILPESLAGGNTARAVGIVPLSKELNAHWVEIWFRNPRKIAEMTSKSHEVARKTLNLEDVRDATVALPPLAEQTRIVAEVERRLSVVEELESVVSANLQRALRLRQSILQKAFTGELC